MPKFDALTTRQYWDSVWRRRSGESETTSKIAGRIAACRHRAQWEFLYKRLPPPGSLLEVGCGEGLWLPHFHQLGWQVHAIDYSEEGCQAARHTLADHGATGEIRRADLFEPPGDLLGRFDLVTSGGVAEHFTDTAGFLRAAARYARPGGLLFTVVPNVAGAIGWLQRILDSECLAMHVMLTTDSMAAAHQEAGLDLIACQYVQIHDFNICVSHPGSARLGLAAQALLKRYTAALILSRIPYPVNRVTASYIYALARIAAP
jgi:2-polyprenyl-3-methyl-5-hydroxy-6-metoxy-1,4-benzoquinol methylase